MKAAGLSKSFKFLPDDTDISNIVHFYKFKTNEKQVIHLFAQVNIMARNKTLLIELSKTTAGVDHPGFDVTVDQQALNAVLRTSKIQNLPRFCAWMLQQEWCKTAPVAENLGGPVPVPVSIPEPEAVIGQQVVTPGPASTDDHTKIMAQIEAERRKVLESQLRTAQAEANAAEAVAKAAEATAKVSETEAKIKEMKAVETERKLSEAKAVETERRLSEAKAVETESRLSEAKAVETERRETEEKQKALLQTPETPDDGVKVAAIADTSSSLKKRRREESPVDNNESKVQRTDEAPAPSAFWTFCMNVTEPFNAIAVLLQQSVDNINPAAGSAI